MNPRLSTARGLALAASLCCGQSYAKSTEIQELLQATGVTSQIEILPELVIQASQANANRCAIVSHPTALPSFTADSVIYDTILSLDPIDASEMQPLLLWFRSPQAKKIHQAELGDYDSAAANEYSQTLASMKARVANISRIITNTRTKEFIGIIGSEIEYAGMLHSGCIAKAQLTTPASSKNLEQMRADGTRGDTIAATLLAGSITTDLAYLLRDLTDAEISEYAAFTESKAALKFYSNLTNAVDKGVRLASDRIKLYSIVSAHP